MKSATGVVGSVVLFGGTSELGRATLTHLLKPGVQHVVLVSRDVEAAHAGDVQLEDLSPDITISHVKFDGEDAASMQAVVDEVFAIVGDIDVAIVAHAVLGADRDGYSDPASVANVIDVNVTATMALLYALSQRMRAQKHGVIALFSSVAGVRVRKANPVYGASKAAIDSFALALGHDLEQDGIKVVVIRPGFVRTKMTAGMKEAPFATDPDKVGEVAAAAISKKATIVYVPGVLRFVFALLSVLPTRVWRRLPIHD